MRKTASKRGSLELMERPLVPKLQMDAHYFP